MAHYCIHCSVFTVTQMNNSLHLYINESDIDMVLLTRRFFFSLSQFFVSFFLLSFRLFKPRTIKKLCYLIQSSIFVFPEWIYRESIAGIWLLFRFSSNLFMFIDKFYINRVHTTLVCLPWFFLCFDWFFFRFLFLPLRFMKLWKNMCFAIFRTFQCEHDKENAFH